MADKKGFSSISLLLFVFFAIMVLIGIGVMAWGMGIFDESMSSITGQIGDVDFNQSYTTYMKTGVVAARTTVPLNMGLTALIGMVVMVLIFGYYSPRISQLWVLFDLIVIIGAEIIAVYGKARIQDFMALDPTITTILTTDLAKPTAFMLNLPTILPTIGFALMVITYIRVRRSRRPDGGELL